MYLGTVPLLLQKLLQQTSVHMSFVASAKTINITTTLYVFCFNVVLSILRKSLEVTVSSIVKFGTSNDEIRVLEALDKMFFYTGPILSVLEGGYLTLPNSYIPTITKCKPKHGCLQNTVKCYYNIQIMIIVVMWAVGLARICLFSRLVFPKTKTFIPSQGWEIHKEISW